MKQLPLDFLTGFSALLGLVFLWMGLLSQLPIPHEKTRDWVVFASALVVFPLALFFFAGRAKKKTVLGSPLVQRMVWSLAVVPVALAVKLVSLPYFLLALGLSFLQTLFGARLKGAAYFLLRPRAIYNLFFLAALWAFGGQLAFWIDHRYLGFLAHHPAAIFLALGLAVGFVELGTRAVKAASPAWVFPAAAVLLAAITAPLCTLAFSPALAHHWGYYVGSAELIKQGGILLHNVPSQYGFLSILFLSQLPAPTPFHALWFSLCVFLFAGALLIFARWRTLFQGTAGALGGVFFVATILYLIPGLLVEGEPSIQYPSVGPFRFLFFYALGAVAFQIAQAGDVKHARHWLWAGHFIWVVSLFWSLESGAYCTAFWGPFVLVTARQSGESLVHQAKDFFLPIAFALTAGGAVCLFYQMRFGFWPDWYAFVEFPAAYLGGLAGLKVDRQGAWVAMVCVLVILMGTSLAVAASQRKRWLPFCVATTAGTWACCSYFLSTSHDNNLLNLFPLFLFSLMGAMHVMITELDLDRRQVLTALAPFFVLPLCMVYTNGETWQGYRRELHALTDPHAASLLEKVSTPAVWPILKGANVTAEEPLIFGDLVLLVRPAAAANGQPLAPQNRLQRLWLPAAPYTEFTILKNPRQREYIARWTKSHPYPGGVVLTNGTIKGATISQATLDFLADYEVTETFRDKDWVLRRYRLKK